MEDTKPAYLYRGVIVNERILRTKPLFGVDLVPPNPPQYDERGRKIVGDGNEYGVYMSDNKEMASEAYAGVSLRDGTPLNLKVAIGDRGLNISVPAVGIVYKINTYGLDVHKPWITSTMKGHYNNGYMGNEWIAEKIPEKNIEVEKVVVGEDLLHPKKEIEFSSVEEIKPAIEAELARRKERLERFEAAMEALPQNVVRRMMSNKLEIYKLIYKENGLLETDLSTLTVNTANDCIKSIMTYLYKENPENIPMNELEFLNNLSKKENITFDELSTNISNELINIDKKRQAYIRHAEEEGEKANTQFFDRRMESFRKIASIYHYTILEQIISKTGISLNDSPNSFEDITQNIQNINQKLEDLYFDGNLSIQVYNAMKKELYFELQNRTASFENQNVEEEQIIEEDQTGMKR